MKKIVSLFLLGVITLVLSNYTQKSNCERDCCRTLADRPPMTYTFYQNTGHFIGGQQPFYINTFGYSGSGSGKLNPKEECNPLDFGPLPATIYKLGYCKNVMHETVQRPCSFYLDPQKPQQTCGRSDFFIHGCQCCSPLDDSEPPADGCSLGCIVINYENRQKLMLGDIIIVHNYETEMSNQGQLFQE